MAKTKQPQNNTTQSTEDAAATFVKELEGILGEQTLSKLETFAEVCSLVDEWRDYCKSNNIALPTEETEEPEKGENSEIVYVNHDTELVHEARASYFQENNIDEDIFSKMEMFEQLEHRKGISDLYNQLLRDKSRKNTINKLGSGPFIKYENEPIVPGELSEPNTPSVAQLAWYKEQVDNINGEIAAIDLELEDIKRQSSSKVSTMIRTRNAARTKELELEKHQLNLKLGSYTSKLT